MTRARVKPENQAATSATGRAFRLLSIAVVAAGAYGADECASTANACQQDPDCLACMNADAAPAHCLTTATTCEGWWDMACCTYGSSEECLANAALLDHLKCLGAGNDCIIDGVCPVHHDLVVEVTDSNDNDGCVPQLTVCIYDTECWGCLNGANPADCAAEADIGTCDAVSEMMCCLYSDNTACRNNSVLNDYAECVAAESGCKIGSLCQSGKGVDSEGVDDDSKGRNDEKGVGAVDESEDEANELAVESRSSGSAATHAAALALVPSMCLSGIAFFFL